MERLSFDDFRPFLEILKNSKKDFVVDISGSTSKIKVDGETLLFSDNHIPLKYLNLIKKVKSHVKKMNLQPPYYKAENYAFRELLVKDRTVSLELENVYEVDVKSFYTTQAYYLGYLSDSIFEELNAIPKKYKHVRQIALGALAKNIIRHEYENGNVINRQRIYERDTATAFHHVAQSCNDICLGIKDESLISFWVDNFIVKDDTEPITQYFESLGFELSVEKLKKVYYDSVNREIVNIYENGKTKSFRFGSYSSALYEITPEETNTIINNVRIMRERLINAGNNTNY